MKVRMLSSCIDNPAGPQFLSSCLVNDRLLVDAGSAGFCSELPEIEEYHLLLTHSHMDHVASLPVLIDRVYSSGRGPVIIHTSAETLYSLREDLFNDRVWVNLERVQDDQNRLVEFHELQDEVEVRILGMTVLPVAVEHTVPALGFMIDDGSTAVVFGADSSATSRIWELACENSRLRGAFIESSYPDRMTAMADITHHLTSAQMVNEVGFPCTIPTTTTTKCTFLLVSLTTAKHPLTALMQRPLQF